ncbi:TonB-dependent receptor plug domain-containing protein [Gracilimonas sp.]|uniref:TonB-dependent receptor plug domain-containing protein n=1 Tax=Gracilimonas sp. TaxID=1974203 RepID=UPI003BA9BFE4
MQILRVKEVADTDNMRTPLTIFVFLSVMLTQAHAMQIADTLKLGEVNVQASRIYVEDRYQPVSVSRIDSFRIENYSSGSISGLLESFGPVHVRTNGPGGLATLSQRGYSPSQTQILWNGFQLNHAMLGLTDLSLIPNFAVEQISIVSGNGNTSFGDKGGGTVAIETRKKENEVGVSHSMGSFGQSISEAHAGFQFENWSAGLTTGYENSTNDFKYPVREFSNEAGGFVEVEKKRTNNRQEAKTGLLTLDWKEESRAFSTVLWIHDMYNEIPGSISGLTPEAYQEDAFVRWMSRYTTPIGNQRLTSKIYFNRQQLDYINPTNSINSLSTSSTLVGDVELRSSLRPNLQLISAMQLGQSWVDATDYSGSARRSQFTVQLNPIWHIVEPVHFYGGIRFDYYTDFEEAYSANAGLNYEVIKEVLFLKGQISRNFIAPTFNDLYWPGLGNPDLDPETNLKYEAGVLAILKQEHIQNLFELTYYNGHVDDGIRWLPGRDGRFRPQNLEELRLWGVELKEELRILAGDFRVNMQAMLIHSLAELKKPRFEDDEAVGKQLRYTPKWQVKTSAVLGWRQFSSLFSYNFTGERYSSADHSSPFDPLDGYTHSVGSISYSQKSGNFRITPAITIQNIFDEEYSVIRDYPMPGRSYQIKLTVKYKIN